jgi:hypothetical protein
VRLLDDGEEGVVVDPGFTRPVLADHLLAGRGFGDAVARLINAGLLEGDDPRPFDDVFAEATGYRLEGAKQ